MVASASLLCFPRKRKPKYKQLPTTDPPCHVGTGSGVIFGDDWQDRVERELRASLLVTTVDRGTGTKEGDDETPLVVITSDSCTVDTPMIVAIETYKCAETKEAEENGGLLIVETTKSNVCTEGTPLIDAISTFDKFTETVGVSAVTLTPMSDKGTETRQATTKDEGSCTDAGVSFGRPSVDSKSVQTISTESEKPDISSKPDLLIPQSSTTDKYALANICLVNDCSPVQINTKSVQTIYPESELPRSSSASSAPAVAMAKTPSSFLPVILSSAEDLVRVFFKNAVRGLFRKLNAFPVESASA